MSRPILSLKKKVSPSNIEVKDHSDDATKSPTPPKKELSPNVKAVKKLYRLKLRYPLSIGSAKSLKIKLRDQGCSSKSTSYAIFHLFTSKKYFDSLVSNAHRYHLDGTKGEVISIREKELTFDDIKKGLIEFELQITGDKSWLDPKE